MSSTAESPVSPQEADGLLASVVLDDDVRQDPVPTYRALHRDSPAWTSPQGMTVVSRYRDCLEYLRSPAWGRSEPDMDIPPGIGSGVGERERERDTHTMLFLNPPDHTRIRSLVSRAFTPKRVERLRPRLGELLAAPLERLDGGEQVDVMSELAVPFPVAVISELLGVPQDPGGEFLTHVRNLTNLIDAAADQAAIDAGLLAGATLGEYFTELVAAKRVEPDDGLLSALIEVEEEGDRLTEEELIVNALLMYAAGFETTSNLIGNGLWALLRFPEQMRRLRDDRSLMPSAIWEILRFDSPVQLNARFSLVDTTLLGDEIPRGRMVTILQGAANHDDEVYEHPERFDVGRFAAEGVPTPLSFGWGAHHCLGAHLARAEGEIFFSMLLDRYERIELAGDPPRYRQSFTLRGLESLRVVAR